MFLSLGANPPVNDSIELAYHMRIVSNIILITKNIFVKRCNVEYKKVYMQKANFILLWFIHRYENKFFTVLFIE